MRRLPSANVVHREHVIGIARDFCVNVNHNERQEHLLRVDLVDALTARREVGRRIHVRSPLTNVAVWAKKPSFLYVKRVRTVSFGNPGQCAIPGPNVWVRSTKSWRDITRYASINSPFDAAPSRTAENATPAIAPHRMKQAAKNICRIIRS